MKHTGTRNDINSAINKALQKKRKKLNFDLIVRSQITLSSLTAVEQWRGRLEPSSYSLLCIHSFKGDAQLTSHTHTHTLVMRGWRLYPRALRMIRGSGGLGNKKVHSDYLRVGRGWIR